MRRRVYDPAVAFRNFNLLGGTTLVVGAGTTARVPAAPTTLDFSGYNTLSLKVHVAGLSGADVFVVALDTVDPETGNLIPAALGRTTLLTITTNGDFATTLTLPSLYPGASSIILPFMQNVLALVNTGSAHAVTVSLVFAELTNSAGHVGFPEGNYVAVPDRNASVLATPGLDWSKNGPGPPASFEAATDGHVPGTYAEELEFAPGGLGATTLSMRMTHILDPGIDTGFVMSVLARNPTCTGTAFARLSMAIANFGAGTIASRQMGGTCNNAGLHPVAVTITPTFARYDFPFTGPECVATNFATGQPFVVFFAFSGGGPAFTATFDIAAITFRVL
jgi:hypothetical protein